MLTLAIFATIRGMSLLERDTELALIGAAVDAAGSGHGSLVLVSGPAGIGKSAVLEVGIDRAACLRRLRARGGEHERAFAFGVVRQLFESPLRSATPATRRALLRDAAAPAAALFGGDASLPAALGEPGVIEHALYWLLANLVELEPAVVVVDDAQWADAASCRWLAYVGRRVEELPVVLLLAVRSGDRAAAHDALDAVEEASAQRVQLGSLSLNATRELLAGRLEMPAEDALVNACHRASGGNPFLLEEIAAALRAIAGPIGPETVEALAAGRVEHFVRRRLARLPDECRGLAEAIAVLGSHARLDHAAELAGVHIPVAVAAADALVEGELLRSASQPTFRHPLLRSAMEQAIPGARRAAMHGRAAQLRLSAGAAPEAVAPHLLAAYPRADPSAVACLRAAAERAAARGAPDAAVVYLQRALAEPPIAADRPAVMRALAYAAWWAGDPRRMDLLREAYWVEPNPGIRADIALAASLVAISTDSADQLAQAEELLAAAEAELGPHELELRALVLSRRAVLSTRSLRPDATARDRLLALQPRLFGRTRAERIALSGLADSLTLAGTPCVRVQAIARTALADAATFSADTAAGRPLILALRALILTDEFAVAAERAQLALDVAEQQGSIFLRVSGLLVRALLQHARGALRAAEADAEQMLALAQDQQLSRLARIAANHLAAVLLDQDRLPDASDLLQRHCRALGEPETLEEAMLVCTRAELHLEQGDARSALSDFLACGNHLRRAQIECPPLLPWRTGAARAHSQLGDRAAALRLADEAVRIARIIEAPRVMAVALRVHGLLTDGPAGLEQLRAAADHAARCKAQLESARCLVELGAALRRANQRVACRPPLRQGRELAHRCGAPALADRAAIELRATGARPRRVFLTGADALTASERRVAELAATDHSNREIAQLLYVTVKTVEKHLGSAYTKLDITSRAQLSQALHQADESP